MNYYKLELEYYIKNIKVEKITIKKLYKFYFMIIRNLINNNLLNKENYKILEMSKQLYLTLNNLDDYNKLIRNTHIRKYIKNIMKDKYNLDIYYDKYYNSENLIEIYYSYELDKLINNNENIMYTLLKHQEYKSNIENTCKLITEQSKELINILEIKNDEYSNYEISIINELNNKIMNYYICLKKINNDEFYIYEKLMNYKQKYNNIKYIFNHFTLPIERYVNHPLITDFLIILNDNNKIRFAIIEYDGPVHYDINNYLFTTDVIERDVIKNNFCLVNNISILRITNINDTRLDNFILNIIDNKICYDIPDYNYYLNMYNNYNKTENNSIDNEFNNLLRDVKSLSKDDINDIDNILQDITKDYIL